MAATGKGAKRPLSEAELAARRANAQLSTGPKNTDATRFNGTKHGMRSAFPVLPGEDGEAYQERIARWMVALDPQDDVQRYLVERAVKASWYADRGDAVIKAHVQIQAAETQAAAALRRAEEIALLAAQIKEDPAVTVRKLRMTPEGITWMLDQWRIIEDYLSTHGELLPTGRSRSLHLNGLRRQDVLHGNTLAIQWLLPMVGVNYGDTDTALKVKVLTIDIGEVSVAAMHPLEAEMRIKELAGAIPSRSESLAAVQCLITQTIAGLEDQLETVQAFTASLEALKAESARVDRSADGKTLLGYQKQQERSLDATLRRIESLQNPRKPRGGGRDPKTAPTEAADAAAQAPTAESSAARSNVSPEESVLESEAGQECELNSHADVGELNELQTPAEAAAATAGVAAASEAKGTDGPTGPTTAPARADFTTEAEQTAELTPPTARADFTTEAEQARGMTPPPTRAEFTTEAKNESQPAEGADVAYHFSEQEAAILAAWRKKLDEYYATYRGNQDLPELLKELDQERAARAAAIEQAVDVRLGLVGDLPPGSGPDPELEAYWTPEASPGLTAYPPDIRGHSRRSGNRAPPGGGRSGE